MLYSLECCNYFKELHVITCNSRSSHRKSASEIHKDIFLGKHIHVKIYYNFKYDKLIDKAE